MKNWIKITVDIDPIDYDLVEQKIVLCTDISGVMETEPKPSTIRLEIYSSQINRDKMAHLADALRKIAKHMVVEAMIYDPADEVEWKKYFKPQKIGSNFVIRPSWEDHQAQPNELVIVIDPGAAFGTGLHETTRGVLVLLEEIAKKMGKDILNAEVLDAGTGSGVLSIGASLLGAKKIKAIDNDPDAVSVAKDNFKINSVDTKAMALCIGVEDEKDKYDVVLANIISDVLIENKGKITSLLRDKAELVLSGILQKDEAKVIDEYSTIPELKLVKTLHMGEWSSIWFSKN